MPWPPATSATSPRSAVAGERTDAVIYGEDETPQFLAAIRRLKQQLHRQEQRTREAIRRLQAALRAARQQTD